MSAAAARYTVAIAAALALAGVGGAAVAGAAQRATMSSSFSPDRLGTSTTITFRLHVYSTTQLVPSPLTSAEVRLPAGMGLATTELGLAICHPNVVMEVGVDACPANSRIGSGHAIVELPLGEVVTEGAEITAFMAPPSGEQTQLLFYAESRSPVAASIIFPAELRADTGANGGEIKTVIPLEPTLPEAPNASVVFFEASIGPRGLTYYRRQNGQEVPFTPSGISTPLTCPQHGFVFSATLGFEDGTHTTVRSKVPCPRGG